MRLALTITRLLLGAGGLALADQPDPPDEVTVALHGVFVRVDPATTEILGQAYRAEVSSFASPPANNELMPLLSSEPFTHGGYLRLTDPAGLNPVTLPFELNIPAFADKNGNHLNDFFETAAAVEGVSSQGAYTDPVSGLGAIEAIWSRTAGSTQGTCRLHLVPLGLEFEHTFHLSEFRGTINYTNGPASRVTSWLKTADLPLGADTLQGPIELVRLGQDSLDISDGVLTNAQASALPFRLEQPLDRAGTNYLGFLLFADGDPTTPEPDFVDYVMIISDPRDTNANGLPDLSDPLQAKPARLRLRADADSVWVTVEGSVGFVYSIETTAVLGSSWVEQTSVLLKQPHETVRLSLPWASGFWRAVAE